MSAVSPATGAERKAHSDAESVKSGKRAQAETTVEVALEHGRWRHAAWVAVGVAAGGLLLWKLGAVGKGLGVILIAMALYNLRSFAMTLINVPGTIKIDADNASLPRGLCRGTPVTVPLSLIKHTFFLRRAVPWTRSGPVLVIETEHQVFAYPRDWFAPGQAGDSDQRRVAMMLNRRLGRL